MELERYLRAYFGNSQEYYIEKYRRFLNGQKLSWNIAPFFLGLFWFLYRRLYVAFIVIIALTLLEGYLEGLIFPNVEPGVFMLPIGFAFAFAMGGIGNYLYLKKAEREIEKAFQAFDSEEARISYLERAGRPNWQGVLLFGIVVLAMLVLSNGVLG